MRRRAAAAGSTGSRRARWSPAAPGWRSALAAWVFWPAHFFAPYLVGYLFWLGIALGCMGLTMLHHLVGGSWGLVIRRPLEAGAATVPAPGLAFPADRLRDADALSMGAARVGRPRLADLSRASYLNETSSCFAPPVTSVIWTALAFLIIAAGRASRTSAATIGSSRPASSARAGRASSSCSWRARSRRSTG